jgi:hypothetical protein
VTKRAASVTRLSVCSAVILLLVLAYAQERPQLRIPKGPQAKATSADWRSREQAFRELMTIGAPESSEIAAEVFQLLSTEREYISRIWREGSASSWKNGVPISEGYSDPYYGDLLSACLRAYRRYPTPKRFVDLAQATYNATSDVALELSGNAAPRLRELSVLAASHDDQYVRLNVRVLLAYAIVKGKFDTATRPAALAVVSAGLNDPSSEVRVGTIPYLIKIGGADVHELLVAARRRGMLRTESKSQNDIIRAAWQNELMKLDAAIRDTQPRR